ncbi:MAG: peptidase domain-containing ABC transporter [Lentisphaeria bacterium]|nr:peptidase domain-containing ABC transporter [Lentisphaeria bacterium]
MSSENNLEQPRLTAIECLNEIIKLLPSGINLEAFLQSSKAENNYDLIFEVSEKLKLSPEKRLESSIDELLAYFGAPVFLELNNGNFVLFLGTRKAQLANQSNMFAVFDPLSKSSGKVIFLETEKVEKAWTKKAIFLRNLNNPSYSADGRHTALYTLTAIARHHGIITDVNVLLHENAINEDEVEVHLLRNIAGNLGLNSKESKVTWDKLPTLKNVFPFMGFTKEGKSVIFCGIRPLDKNAPVPENSVSVVEKNDKESEKEENKEELLTPEVVTAEDLAKEKAAEKQKAEYELVLWDPLVNGQNSSRMRYVDEKSFKETISEKVIFFKRHYSLLDDNQPFRLRWFIPEFMRQKALLTQVAIAILAISLIGLAIPLFFQIVVDKVLVHQSYNTLTVLGIGVSILLVFNAMLEYLQNYFLLFATNRIDIRLATRTFAKLLSLPVDFYERISSGVLIKHMQQTEKIRSFLSGSLFHSALELFSLVVFLPFLLFYSVKLTLVVLFFTFLMALVIAVLIKPFQARLEELYMAEGKRQGMLVETINGIRTVKSLALEPTQQRKWNDTAAFAITRYFRVAKISLTARTISQLLEKFMFIAVIWIGANSVFDGEMSVGALIAFQMLSGRVTAPLVRIVGLVHEYQQTALSVRMLGVVMNSPKEQVGGTLQHKLRGELSLENLKFQYTADGPVVIKDFNLHIAPGMTVGLVGRSGSGKTTVTKLIQGLYPLQGGIIKFDGIDIREIDSSCLRSNIGVVLQDNYFFHGTIKENLSVTKKDATMEEIIYVARMAGADEFIQRMSKGYESLLEENASNLSGGQRQRLAIARALLPNPRILIFDEATSALDPESETMIRRNLKMIARNRTVFIISHRLSILCRADNIVVMDKGEIVEQGNHKNLIAKNGLYASFWNQQMGTEDDE